MEGRICKAMKGLFNNSIIRKIRSNQSDSEKPRQDDRKKDEEIERIEIAPNPPAPSFNAIEHTQYERGNQKPDWSFDECRASGCRRSSQIPHRASASFRALGDEARKQR